MGKRKSVGFSLMELLLTITILIILSLVSGPIYRSHAYKAKLAEGYALLGTIRSAQQTYFGEYGNFLERKNTAHAKCGGDANGHQWLGTANEEVLGIDARSNKYYTWFNICWSTQRANPSSYAFTAGVYGTGAPHLFMMFNQTSGVTMASGSTSNISGE